MKTLGRAVWVAAAALVGWSAGWVAGSVGHVNPQPAMYPFLAERVPPPHHVPQFAGGASFRFAMVQDVIHERFAKHGPAHYRERDRITREKLRSLASDDPATFPLSDDLGVGLDRLGKSDEAVEVMRAKLALQARLSLSGRALYTSYANLGTFLIHGSAKKAASGDEPAKRRFREGVELVRKSVEVNPQAHFGREQWQVVIAEFLLAAMADPSLLQKYDCLGNSLSYDAKTILNRENRWMDVYYGRPFDLDFQRGLVDVEVPEFFHRGMPLDDPSRWTVLRPIREHITKVGAEYNPKDSAVPVQAKPSPFDEPMLGIIGMWRQGGGANPHFALALGETMLRVGQRYIAWAAFERASRLADRYSGDQAAHEFLRQHCRRRQAEIERSFAAEVRDSPRPPPTGDKLRAQFDAELTDGEGFQKAYQDYEAKKIAGGASITDGHFFEDFPRRDEVVASPSGPEETFVRVPRRKIDKLVAASRFSWAIFGAGLAAFAAALLQQLRSGRSSSPGSKPKTGITLQGPVEIVYVNE